MPSNYIDEKNATFKTEEETTYLDEMSDEVTYIDEKNATFVDEMDDL